MTETAIRFRDDPWSRLPWLVPAALVLTLLSQIAFLSLLRQPANQLAPRPVDVQIVELPVTVTPPAPQPAPPAQKPPPPAPRRVEPPPRPTPPQPEARVEVPRDPTPPAAEEPMMPAPEAAATVPVPATPAAPGTVVGPPVAALPSPPAPQAAPPPAQIPPRITRPARPSGGYQVRPAYPAAARQARAEGTTLLRVHIRADGTIDDVQVSRSAGHAALDEAAAAAVTRWRFEPARSGSEAVAVWVLIPVEFRLQNEN
jgi:protein TonB